jgi:Arc/MetJ-type ribon-helix-helix transcriptional regulator
MASLAPPISIHLTRRQLRWLDGRRRLRNSLSRSAALRQAIDELIQQQEGSPCPSAPAQPAATAPRQLELTASSTTSTEA